MIQPTAVADRSNAWASSGTNKPSEKRARP
jgi:hypothetical protein